MSAGVGLVVNCDGSGCRLVEYDGTGRVVGPGERITLSENNAVPHNFMARFAPTLASEAEPAIWSDPRVRAAGITLADVLGGSAGSAPSVATGSGVDLDPQAAFVTLAEAAGSYQVAAREHPEVWAAYRAAADLNGWTDDDPGEEVARLVEQAMADDGLTAAEATYLVMDQRPDLWNRTRGVRT